MHRVRVAGRVALVVAVVVASGFAGWATREGKPAPGRDANVIPFPRRTRFAGTSAHRARLKKQGMLTPEEFARRKKALQKRAFRGEPSSR
jgi:hypothetical protein